MQTGAFHAPLRLRVLHESAPNEPRSQVLGHQQDDPRVDSDDVRIIPVLEGIKGIDEAVLGPGRGIPTSDVP